MKTISINPQTQEIEELDLEMKANTIYSFFNSILIDEMPSLNQHIIYADANALNQKQKPYFIGEQIVIGNALIVGQNGMEETDAIIPHEDLKSIISFEVPMFYEKVLNLINNTDINLYRTFAVNQQGQKIQLNTEWVLYTFNIADDKTREYFINELTKVIEDNESIENYMIKMAQLAINAAG